MKLFAVYANVALTYKPDWLDSFRAKYDKPYPHHVTLKQTCYVEDEKIADIRQKLSAFFANLDIPDHTISLKFDHAMVDATDGSVLVCSTENVLLSALQTDLVHALRGYDDYLEPRSKEWEKDFHPHITIARDLTAALLAQARSELHDSILLEGSIKEITLVVVHNLGPQEANPEKNLTRYRL